MHHFSGRAGMNPTTANDYERLRTARADAPGFCDKTGVLPVMNIRLQIVDRAIGCNR
jgi:hypothetical protein